MTKHIIPNDHFSRIEGYLERANGILDSAMADHAAGEPIDEVQIAYHAGALHAFADTLEAVETVEKKGHALPVAIAVVVTTVVVIKRNEIRDAIEDGSYFVAEKFNSARKRIKKHLENQPS